MRVKKPFIVSLRNLYFLPFTLRKDVLYECLKKLVKIRQEDLNAFFTASLRNHKFKISCCAWKIEDMTGIRSVRSRYVVAALTLPFGNSVLTGNKNLRV